MNRRELIFNKLKKTYLENKASVFIEYCKECILEKETKNIREEEVAYNICGALSIDGLSNIPQIESIIDHACQMEFSRESSTGAGISLNDKWTKENADKYKQKQWKELLRLLEKVKESLTI